MSSAWPDIHSLAAAVQRGDRSATENARTALERIDAQRDLGAFIHLDEGRTLDDARQVDARVKDGEQLPLAGVPVAIKDNLCVRGVPTTCASRMLERFVPPYDATSVRRLIDAGAVIVGKTNLDEFAMGSSNENSSFGPARNPWAPDRTPGGSSGGSAAAVAAGMTPAALGSDTGGSIRQPAAFCGAVGLKPTYGRVSRYGLVAFGSSLDQVGPLTARVGDAALLLEVMAGADRHDATCSDAPPPDIMTHLEDGVAGLRVGIPQEYMGDGIDPGVRAAVTSAAARLDADGAEVREVSPPHTSYAIPAYYVVATSEASSNLARYDGIHYGRRAEAPDLFHTYERSRTEGLGPEVRRRILLGTYALSAGHYDAYYDRAMRVRTLIRRDFERAFEDVDVILSPTGPTPAFRLGEKTTDPLEMYLADILTVAANLAGVPGLVVPETLTAFEGADLPVGLQLMGPMWGEATLCRVGHHLERTRPPLPSAPAGGSA